MSTSVLRHSASSRLLRQQQQLVPGSASPAASCRLIARAQQATSDNFMDNVKRMAKRVQGALPIVGLVSRLAAPAGGFDEQSYPEFCRGILEKPSPEFMAAQQALEKAYGKPGNVRWTLLILWMCKCGVGLVSNKDFINAAKRLRVTLDIEMEMDRFEQNKAIVLKKYQLIERPQGKLKDKLMVSVDALSVLIFGSKEGEPVPSKDVQNLTTILQYVYPEADKEMLSSAIADKPQRNLAYA